MFLGNYYGNGSGPIWHERLQCTGNETSFGECGHHDTYFGRCTHRDDVSIACDDGNSKCCCCECLQNELRTLSVNGIMQCSVDPQQHSTNPQEHTLEKVIN